MGIKSLLKVRIKNARSDYSDMTIADMGKPINMKDLEGERVAMDTLWAIYSTILAMQNVSSLTDSQGNITSHILIILNKVLAMKKAGVRQVWIFDSPTANPMKANENAKRKEKRVASNNEKVQFVVKKQHIDDIQELFKHMGILYIVAPPGIEAEQYGAMLTMGEDRYCKYMISGDTDVLVFGGNLLKPVSKKTAAAKNAKTSKKAVPEKVPDFLGFELDDILKEMLLTREKFVKMGLALGSDFAEKTPGLGPTSVHTKARYDKIVLTPEQEIAYNYFMQPVGVSDSRKSVGVSDSEKPFEISEAHLVENTYNKDNLMQFLEERGFTREKYEKRIDAAYAE